VCLNVVTVKAYVVDVRQGRHVDLVNARHALVINALPVRLELVMNTDGGQLVSRAQAGRSRASNRAAHHRALRLVLVEVQ